MTCLAAIINPASGNGRSVKCWRLLQPALEAVFEQVVFKMSENFDNLDSLTDELLAQDPEIILILGGDGTLSRVLNSLIADDTLKKPQTQIAFFDTGTCSDYIKNFQPQQIDAFVERLVKRQAIQTDVGKILYADNRTGYFINIASCGFTGKVVSVALQCEWLKKILGSVHYLLLTVFYLFIYQSTPLRIQIDEQTPFESTLVMAAFCNGHSFASGIQVAPTAKINDGLLEIVLFKHGSFFSVLRLLYQLYRGKASANPQLVYAKGKSVRVEPVDQQQNMIEADGEFRGFLPATFTLMKNQIALIL